MREGFTVKFNNLDDALKYAEATALNADWDGHKVDVSIEIKYVEEGQEDNGCRLSEAI